MKNTRPTLGAALAGLSVLALATASGAAEDFVNVADTSGGLVDFGYPSLNNNGTVLVTSATGPFDSALYTSTAGGPLTAVYDTSTPSSPSAPGR